MPTVPGIPGPRMPRALQALGFVTRTVPFMARQRARYGDVFEVNIADEKPWVIFSEPDHVREIFTGDPAVFHAGKGNRVLLPLLGDHSVLLLDDDAHLRQRRLLLPPFHGERMARYGDLIRDAAEREVATWPVGEPLQLAPRMQDVTLEVIMRAVFGMREGAELDHVRGALLALLDRVMHPATFAMMLALGPDRMRTTRIVRDSLAPADAALLEEFSRRRDAADLAEREDILSLLLQARHEDGSPMSDQELRDELMTLLVAGQETTATALSWAVERLVRHPQALAALRDDLDAGGTAYLEAVIHETLRLRPVLPVVVRDLQADVEIGGHHLPAGTRIAASITLAHRNPDVYPDPHAFRPERWLGTKPGTYTWIPFGGGIRRCLGASFALFEMQQVLPVLVQSLDLRATDPAPERVARRAITLTPARRAEVVVERRRERPAGRAAEPETVAA